jgi:hypothetical protein
VLNYYSRLLPAITSKAGRAAALPTPLARFNICLLQTAQVNNYQAVRFDGKGVSRRWAFRPVTVKGYVDRVEGVADGLVVPRHARSYQPCW